VLEALAEHGLSLGGEQSGHIIFSEHATTGDGILTGLQLAAEMVRSRRTLAELADVMTVFPQVLINVRGVDRSALEGHAVIAAAVAAEEVGLGDSGRVLLRASGTEPMVRIMVEAAEHHTAQQVADRLVGVVRAQLAI
jgi:phosphoglucosamine mutase